MCPLYRWLIAIDMFIVMLGVGFRSYKFASFMGGMVTDLCSNLLGLAFGWLTYVVPLVALAAIFIPPVLVICNSRGRWVLLSVGLGSLGSIGCYCLWFPMLMLLC